MLTRHGAWTRLEMPLPESSYQPLGFAAGDANLYRYVRNSPTNATDPSGNFLVFTDKKQAADFVNLMKTKYGAKNVHVVQGEKQTYVSFDPRDTAAVGRYADDQWPNNLKGLPKEKADIEAGERRNRFLVASGIFGTVVGRFGYAGLDDRFFGNIQGDDNVDVDFENDLDFLLKAVESIENSKHPVILNIGGEDNEDDPKGVININIKGIGDGGHRIPNLFLRFQYDSRFSEIPDGVATRYS